MKKKLIITGLAITALIGIGAGIQQEQHECFILWASVENNAPIFARSMSKGVPTQLTNINELAEGIAFGLDLGYKINMQSPNGLTVTMVK